MATPARRRASNPALIAYIRPEAVASRIIKRHAEGAHDVARRLLVEELCERGPAHRYELAVNLAQHALDSLAAVRARAEAEGLSWTVALPDPATGALVTIADAGSTGAGMAVRLLDAMHRSQGGQLEADRDAAEVQEEAMGAEPAVLAAFLTALTAFAARASHGGAVSGHALPGGFAPSRPDPR